MDKVAKRAKLVKLFGIITVCILPTFIILFIIATATWILAFNIIGYLLVAAYVPLAVTAAILILVTDWGNEELNNCKLLWGLLSIFLLPSIGPIVFGVKACKLWDVGTTQVSNEKTNNVSTPTKKNTNFSNTTNQTVVLEKIEKIKEMYQEELLTEAQAVAKINKILTESSL